MYPINTYVSGVCNVPKTILGAGDTKTKDSAAKSSRELHEGTGVKRASAECSGQRV